MKIIGVILLLLCSIQVAYAQNGCTALGQTPETAFPVCTRSVFKQVSVPVCTNHHVAVPGCGNAVYSDKNPYWYKFTCFKSGTLSFLVKPNDQGDDYDWQLFDITGHKPTDVYSDSSLIVAGNWAGTFGNTGANAKGINYTQCASDPNDHKPSFAKSPELIAGHQYLLMISHFTDSQSGYSLSFSGGTAVITDTTAPRLKKATPGCAHVTISILLSKRLLCKTLAKDGSDFILSPKVANVIAASSADCNGFDMGSLTLTLDKKLAPGNYTISIQNGTDGNTLLDNCGTGISVGDKASFEIEKVHFTPMDSVLPVGCAPKAIRVMFDGAMRCNSFATDGSDFSITGPSVVTVTGAKGVDCQNNMTSTIEVMLARPIVKGGEYTLVLKPGSDGNTGISQCDVETPTETLIFKTKDTVSAEFSYREADACNEFTIYLNHNGANGVNQWLWTLGNGSADTLQKVSYTDTTFTQQHIHLRVSNGVCEDSSFAIFQPDKEWYLKAAFEEPAFICPNDEATFIDHSMGDISTWDWNFGNGHTSFLQDPPRQQYPMVIRTKDFPVRLVIENMKGCRDTAIQMAKVINNCFIAVPTAFTPNGDGMNDYLYPLNAYKARDLDFKIYNRYGQLVFETKDWTRKWDGTFHGTPQPMGSYVWMLSYINTDTGEKVFKKGATLLIR